MKFKYCHIEALKRIHNKYKFSRPGSKITRHLKSRKNIHIYIYIYTFEYCIMREGAPFSLKSLKDIISEEKDELLPLIYEVEYYLNCRVTHDIEVQLVAKLPDKEYGEHEFSFREIYFMNGFDEYVDEDIIDEVLNKAVEELKTDIRRPK